MLNSPTLPHEVPTSQAVFRRIGLRTVPLLFACYVVNMLDRLNVGFAKLQFLADLHLNEAVFGVAAGFLYLGYIPFEVPRNLMLHRYGARKTLLRIMILWASSLWYRPWRRENISSTHYGTRLVPQR
jgi:hypothetical protein